MREDKSIIAMTRMQRAISDYLSMVSFGYCIAGRRGEICSNVTENREQRIGVLEISATKVYKKNILEAFMREKVIQIN